MGEHLVAGSARWLAPIIGGGLCVLVACGERGRAAPMMVIGSEDGVRDAAMMEDAAAADAGVDDAVDDAGVDDAGDDASSAEVSDYWVGLARPLEHSLAGNPVAIACHNCYEDDLLDSEQNLAATLSKLHTAQADGADLLELDVKEESGTWYVGHDDDGTTHCALFDDVIADPQLRAGDQPLFIEFKESEPNEESLRSLLESLEAEEFGAAGRAVILRAFRNRIANLTIADALIAGSLLPHLATHTRLQVLYTQGEAEDVAGIERLLEAAAHDGFDAVEFNYASAHVVELLARAHELGLGTNVWTFGVDDGAAQCAAFRDVTDSVTTDAPIAECRAAITQPRN